MGQQKVVAGISVMQAVIPPMPPPAPPTLLPVLSLVLEISVAVLAIGVCVFFVYNETFSQTSNNKLAKE